MNKKEKLIIAQEIYGDYIQKNELAIAYWEKEWNINPFDIFLENAIEIEKTKENWYTPL